MERGHERRIEPNMKLAVKIWERKGKESVWKLLNTRGEGGNHHGALRYTLIKLTILKWGSVLACLHTKYVVVLMLPVITLPLLLVVNRTILPRSGRLIIAANCHVPVPCN